MGFEGGPSGLLLCVGLSPMPVVKLRSFNLFSERTQGCLCPSDAQNGRGRKAAREGFLHFFLCLPEKEEAPRGAGLPSFVSWFDSLWLPFCSPSQPGLF